MRPTSFIHAFVWFYVWDLSVLFRLICVYEIMIHLHFLCPHVCHKFLEGESVTSCPAKDTPGGGGQGRGRMDEWMDG